MLDSALGWIGDLVIWLARFIPRCEIVDSTQHALKWVNPLNPPWVPPKGQRVVVCGPGRHWYWPWTTKWEAWATARSTRDLPVQTITTSDGHVFTVRTVLAFEVTDLVALLAHTEDPNDTVRDLAGSAVHEVLSDATREQILNKDLSRRLKGAAERALRDYGVHVIALTMLECAPARVYRLVQNPVTDNV